MKLMINVRHLMAANLFAGKEKVRYYLHGVLVKREGGLLSFVGTDGHRLAKFEFKDKGADFHAIVPYDLIKKIVMDKKTSSVGELEIRKQRDKENVRQITLRHNGQSYSADEVDGTFPDYKRVFPDFDAKAKYFDAQRKKMKQADKAMAYMNQHYGFSVGFNAGYLGDFAAIARACGMKTKGIRIEMADAVAPAKVTIGGLDNFVGLLMPMRV